MSDSVQSHGLQPSRLLQPWDSPGKCTGVGCKCPLCLIVENLIKKAFWRVPWWSSGKESTCQCRRHRFNPWSREMPHVLGLLSLCAATATELMHPRALLGEKRRHHRRSLRPRPETDPYLVQQEKSPHASTEI